jgi:hypothetical protein
MRFLGSEISPEADDHRERSASAAGRASIFCTVLFLFFAFVSPKGNSVFLTADGVILLTGFVLGICAGIIGTAKWFFTAILALVSGLAGSVYMIFANIHLGSF